MRGMKASAAALGMAMAIASSALAQAPFKSALPRPPCDECGTITSMQALSRELSPQPMDEGEPSGLVATIPFGNAPVRAGSSSRVGKDTPNVSTRWDVVVRMDDGRYRVLSEQSKPAFAQGDRVRVHEGKLERAPGE